MMFAKKSKFLFGLILALSFFLRFFLLGNFPPSLNRDEAAIGWNAYSILKTSRDEWGQKLPLSFKSFGDYKMPLYIYFTVPFIKIFGLNEFAVRFSSAFFGGLTVLLVYFLVKEVFSPPIPQPRRLKDKPPRFSLAVIASFLLAISPWHLFYSRVAFEANLCLFLVVLGLTLLFFSFKKRWYLVLSSLFFWLSFYAYSSVFIFLPLFLLITIFLYRKKIFQKGRFLSVFLAALILIFGFAHAAHSVWQVSSAKRAITVFSDPTTVDKFNRLRGGYYAHNPILARILLNKFTYFGQIVFKNYLATFSPRFLFISGGNHPWHSIPNFGNFYLIEAVFLIFGLIVWWRLKGKVKWFLAAWLLSAPLASAITVDAPHSTRSLPTLIPMLILISLGIVKLISFFKKKIIIYCFGQRPINLWLILFTVYCLLFARWLYSYFYVYPRKLPDSLMYGLKQALLFMQEKNPDKEVVVLNPLDSPYIYTLFHLKIDPGKFQNTTERYGAGIDGFEHVRSFDDFEFLYGLPEEMKTGFYILREGARFGLEESKAVKKISNYKKDEVVFTVYEF